MAFVFKMRSEWISPGSGLLVGLVAGIAYLFPTAQVAGPSMEPTLNPGDRLTYSRFVPNGYHPGDIVILHLPDGHNTRVVKRIFATEGQMVPFLVEPDMHPASLHGYIVPKGHVYVLGDNLEESQDSREFDAIPVENVEGRVLFWGGTPNLNIVQNYFGPRLWDQETQRANVLWREK